MVKRSIKRTVWVLVMVILISVIPGGIAEQTAIAPAEALSQYKTLTVGYNGPEVAALKQRMFELGYFKSKTVNNSYTTSTADYVKNFEKVNGLLIDGIADPEMQALFFSDKARKADGTFVVPEKNVALVEVTLPETEEAKQVNQRFSEFLAGIGAYGESEIQKMQFNDRSNKREFDLGLFTAHTWDGGRVEVQFQAVLLFHKNIDGSEIMAIGVKDRKGNRKITVICWPIRTYFEIHPQSVVVAEKSNKLHEGKSIERFDKEDKVGAMLDSKVGFVLKYHIYAAVKDTEGLKYLTFFLEKTTANRQFLSVIWRPSGRNYDIALKKFISSLKTQGKLLEIENYQELISTFQDIDNLPVVTFFTYRFDLH